MYEHLYNISLNLDVAFLLSVSIWPTPFASLLSNRSSKMEPMCESYGAYDMVI